MVVPKTTALPLGDTPELNAERENTKSRSDKAHFEITCSVARLAYFVQAGSVVLPLKVMEAALQGHYSDGNTRQRP